MNVIMKENPKGPGIWEWSTNVMNVIMKESPKWILKFILNKSIQGYDTAVVNVIIKVAQEGT